MKRLILITYYLFACSWFANAQSINSALSKVDFTIDNMKWKTVEGTFTGMKGDLNFDTGDLANSSFKVCIDATSINSQNEKRDDHLKKEDFLNTKQYPNICFVSSQITKTDKGFKTRGKLTMLGVSKEKEILFTYANKHFSGQLEINRFDFNLAEATSVFMMGETIGITINCIME